MKVKLASYSQDYLENILGAMGMCYGASPAEVNYSDLLGIIKGYGVDEGAINGRFRMYQNSSLNGNNYNPYTGLQYFSKVLQAANLVFVS